MTFSKMSQPKSIFLNTFQKFLSEMNFTYPFYPILIPNTPFLKFLFFLILFVGWSQTPKQNYWYLEILSTRVCKKIFLLKQNYFYYTGCLKKLWEGVTLNISKNSLRSELHTSFLPYLDIKHSICEMFIFLHFVCFLSEINFIHPFYPIMIHNTLYGKFFFFFILFVGGSQN